MPDAPQKQPQPVALPRDGGGRFREPRDGGKIGVPIDTPRVPQKGADDDHCPYDVYDL